MFQNFFHKIDTPSYTNKQHSNKQFLNKQYSKLQQKLPIVSTCKLPNLEFGLKFWHQILPIYSRIIHAEPC
jgi:hypothetical protein